MQIYSNFSSTFEWSTLSACSVVMVNMYLFTKDGLSSVDLKNVVEALHSGMTYYMTMTSSHDESDEATLPYKLNDDKGIHYTNWTSHYCCLVFNVLLSTSLQLLPPLLQQLNPTSHKLAPYLLIVLSLQLLVGISYGRNTRQL